MLSRSDWLDDATALDNKSPRLNSIEMFKPQRETLDNESRISEHDVHLFYVTS